MVDVDTAAITHRLRTRFAEVQGRVVELPVTVRSTAQRLVEKLRTALDLPSRSELADLTQRLEALDRRISELATTRVQEMSRTVPSLPAPTEPEPAGVIEVTARPATEAVAEADVVAEAAVEPGAEPAVEVEATADAAVEAPAEAAGEATDVEAAADAGEPAADAAPGNAKDRRRSKGNRRSSANKTSRR